MAIEPQAICDALAVNLRTATGDIIVTPFYDDLISADAEWSSAEIGPKSGENEINADLAQVAGQIGSRVMLLYLDVTLYLVMADAEAAQKRMSTWMSFGTPTSVWDALESDRTLGGLAMKLIVRPSVSYFSEQRGGQRFIRNSWTVQVWAKP